jgi:exopolyphosphatase/guanosine-5'-triphosphate,3'-diphosphate pyrophosphatase
MRRSVIDVGSNSVLLLVSEYQNDKWQPIFEDTAVTALGEGTKQTGLLSEAAMTRTLDAVKKFADKAHELNASPTTIAATMAARIATNTSDLITRAEQQGTAMTVLTGEQEAMLGFESVVSDPIFSHENRITILDPGGQSTEIVLADRTASGWNILFKKSYPVGTLGLKTLFFPNEQASGIEILRASSAIDATVGAGIQPQKCGTVVTLGAAGTNLVSIRDYLATWQPQRVHGARLSYEEISTAVGQLMPLTDKQRAEIVGMEPGREKTIHVGALMVERFHFALRAESCLVSVRGWRHALLEKGSPEPL